MERVIAWKPAAPNPELASARLRCFRPLEYLNRAGWQCELFDRGQMHRYRVVVFQKCYGDEDLDLAAHLRGLGVRTVFDLCDNHFYNPSGRSELRIRADRLRRMIDSVDAVTASTPQLAEIVGRQCAIIDDAIDDVPAPAWSDRLSNCWRRRGPALRLAWFGNAGQDEPPFGLVDLARIRPALETLHRRRLVELTVISNSRPAFDRWMSAAPFPVHYHDWDNCTYQRILRACDLCLIPVNVNPFTLCKTNNRMAIALLLGLPVVADAIPSYEELRPFALFGRWDESIFEYAADTRRTGQNVRDAQRHLRSKYTPERVVDQWSSVIRPLAA